METAKHAILFNYSFSTHSFARRRAHSYINALLSMFHNLFFMNLHFEKKNRPKTAETALS
jgi:hypothetical protein